jgi:hypothetical protein
MEGEDISRYNGLLTAVCQAVKPKDFIDCIWVRDIVDDQWDILRLREVKAGMITAAAESPELAVTELSLRSKLDLTMPLAVTEALPKILEVDRMIGNLEVRRDNSYREGERRKSNRGQRSRSAVKEIEDVEFRVLDDNSTQEKSAA